MPSPAPWARALLLCNIPGCLSVCLFRFCCLKGKHQRECPHPVPIPSLCVQVPVHYLSLKGDTVSSLTSLASGHRGFGSRSQSLAKLLWRGGGVAVGLWRADPPGRSLLGAAVCCQGSQLGSESRAQSVAKLQCLPQTLICCRGCCTERSVWPQGVWEEESHTCDSVPFSCLCFLCAWAPAPEPPPCCRSASVLESPRWEDPNLKQKTKIRIGLQPLPLPSSVNLSPVRSPSPCLVKSVGKRGKTRASFPCLGSIYIIVSMQQQPSLWIFT